MKKISQKTRVIIYVAVIIAIIAFGAMAVLSQKSGGESLLDEKLELGQQYLLELSYDKAVLEFTDAINIEPKNADAYIGLAEAYRGMGDHEKADEVLRLGFEKTGDARLNVAPVTETTTETTPPATETSTATAKVTTVTTVTERSETTTPKHETTVKHTTLPALTSHVETLFPETKPPVTTAERETITVVHVTEETTTSPTETTEETTVEETTVSEETSVTEPKQKYSNEELAEAVRLLIKDPAAEIDQEMLDEIKSVEIFGEEHIAVNESVSEKYGINKITIEGSAYTINDDTIRYYYGELLNLEFAGRISNLESLTVMINKIKDVSDAENIINLKELNLAYNDIRDVTPIYKCDGLKSVELSGNTINIYYIKKFKTTLPECKVTYMEGSPATVSYRIDKAGHIYYIDKDGNNAGIEYTRIY